jgi:hypothetical protein
VSCAQPKSEIGLCSTHLSTPSGLAGPLFGTPQLPAASALVDAIVPTGALMVVQESLLPCLPITTRRRKEKHSLAAPPPSFSLYRNRCAAIAVAPAMRPTATTHTSVTEATIPSQITTQLLLWQQNCTSANETFTLHTRRATHTHIPPDTRRGSRLIAPSQVGGQIGTIKAKGKRQKAKGKRCSLGRK